MSLMMICSTSHRQRAVHCLFLLVAGAVRLCLIVLRKSQIFVILISWCTCVEIVKRFVP